MTKVYLSLLGLLAENIKQVAPGVDIDNISFEEDTLKVLLELPCRQRQKHRQTQCIGTTEEEERQTDFWKWRLFGVEFPYNPGSKTKELLAVVQYTFGS